MTVHVESSTGHGVACAERAVIYANRVQVSRGYTILCSCALALSALLLLWVVIEADYPLGHAIKFWTFVLADGAVTLFVVVEIVISLVAQGVSSYCRSCCNWLDIAVAVLCVSTIFLHMLGPTAVCALPRAEGSAHCTLSGSMRALSTMSQPSTAAHTGPCAAHQLWLSHVAHDVGRGDRNSSWRRRWRRRS